MWLFTRGYPWKMLDLSISFHINHHFPMVFPWFPHGFPMVFPHFHRRILRPFGSPKLRMAIGRCQGILGSHPGLPPGAPRSPKRIWQFGKKKLNKYIYIYIGDFYRDLLSNYLSICLSVCLSVYLSIYLPTYLSTYLSIYLSLNWTFKKSWNPQRLIYNCIFFGIWWALYPAGFVKNLRSL